MIKTIEGLDRRNEELDEGQRRMTDAANELFKIDGVIARLEEFDHGQKKLKCG